ncbi:MAG: hypothetical protein WHX52_01685 [Anaerolineae bacterium]
MNIVYRTIAGRIRADIAELAGVVERTLHIWKEGQTSGAYFYLDAVALNLHSFYAGVERLLEIIADGVDETKPTGAQWHQQLLRQMTSEIAEVRPAVLSHGLRERLDRYRGFRHVVRNVYTFNLDSEQIEILIRHLPETMTQLRQELLAFADFLDAVSG